MARRWGATIALTATAVAALAAYAGGAVAADLGEQVERRGGGWIGAGSPFPLGAGSAKVPACVDRGDLKLFRSHREESIIVRRRRPPTRIRRAFKCLLRLTLTADALAGRFVTAIGSQDAGSACRLLSGEERERLGDCEAAFGSLGERMRAEREPQVEFALPSVPRIRGEITIRLVRPFEKVGLRFVREGDALRISNVRDLFRQEPPPAPAARRPG